MIVRKNIIVTTPKSEMEHAAEEAAECIKNGSGYYFRRFKKKPLGLQSGSKIYYVEDGHIRGFASVATVVQKHLICDTTGKDWGHAYHAIMAASSWKWIKPIPMKGFQGFRYFDDSDIEIIGEWLDPKPEKYNEL